MALYQEYIENEQETQSALWSWSGKVVYIQCLNTENLTVPQYSQMQIKLGLGWLADISHDHHQPVAQRQQRALVLIIDKPNH
jgi:hypothetical protein